MNNADLNEMAHTKLILSIDVKSNSGKSFSASSKDVENRDYTDEKSALAWDKFKKSFDSVSASSLVKK
jgi:hypothetical protein